MTSPSSGLPCKANKRPAWSKQGTRRWISEDTFFEYSPKILKSYWIILVSNLSFIGDEYDLWILSTVTCLSIDVPVCPSYQQQLKFTVASHYFVITEWSCLLSQFPRQQQSAEAGLSTWRFYPCLPLQDVRGNIMGHLCAAVIQMVNIYLYEMTYLRNIFRIWLLKNTNIELCNGILNCLLIC